MNVYAISLDDVEDLASFAEKQELNFQLLSDPDGSAASKFGVLTRRGYASRTTFILDEKGVLREIIGKVDVKAHGANLVKRIQKLQQG